VAHDDRLLAGGIDGLTVTRPLPQQGVDRDDLVRVARAIAYETVFRCPTTSATISRST
jgi:hypothetical protein